MRALLVLFLEVMLPMAALAAGVWLCVGAGRRLLEGMLAPRREFLKRAHEIALRIAANLRDADPELARSCAMEVDAILDRRLPRILDQYDRLGRHVSGQDRQKLEAEVFRVSRKLQEARDPELRRLLDKNLSLAKERLSQAREMAVLAERSEAQLGQVMLYLEALESRTMSLGVTAPQEAVSEDLGRLLGEVSSIEKLYREMDARPEGQGDGVSGEETSGRSVETVPEDPERTRDDRERVRRKECGDGRSG